ncbi:MAG TPA: hypothetical protein PLB78_16895, partial [Anaerolineae bacterium]|nr:hypothetical protein [Anaerolineae bacterium]
MASDKAPPVAAPAMHMVTRLMALALLGLGALALFFAGRGQPAPAGTPSPAPTATPIAAPAREGSLVLD